MTGQSVPMLCQDNLLVAEDCLLPLPRRPHYLNISGCCKMHPLTQCHLPINDHLFSKEQSNDTVNGDIRICVPECVTPLSDVV